MRIYILLFFLIFLACSDEDPTPLVKKYDLSWDSNIGLKYNGGLSLPNIEFISITELPSGFVIFSRSYAVAKGFVTKTDLKGNFVNDVTVEGEYLVAVFPDENGGVNLISVVDGKTFSVRNFDDDLALKSKTEFDISLLTFAKFFYLQDGIMRVRSDNFNIDKFDFKGNLVWTKKISQFGLPEFINPLLQVGRNVNEFTFVYFSNDNLDLVQVDSKTGETKWRQTYNITADFGGATFRNNFRWSEQGKLYFAGMKTVNAEDFLSLVVLKSNGTLDVFKEIPLEEGLVSGAGAIIPTKDNGSIISLDAGLVKDLANFRLMKLDSKANTGWIGTFNNDLGFDFLTDIIERNDGEVIFLTYYGYVAGLKPAY